MRLASCLLYIPLLLLAGCGDDSTASGTGGQTTTATSTGPGPVTTGGDLPTTGGDSDAGTAGTMGMTGTSEASTTTTASSSTGGGTKLDVGFGAGTTDDPGMADLCKVQDDMNAVGDCKTEAPPDSFMPDVQWMFVGEGMENQAVATPLVANMTDDNGDGAIDLCDVPDVVVPIYGAQGISDGHLYVLDGETGAVKLKMTEIIDGFANPAIGDIDSDGLPEVVTIRSEINNPSNGHAIVLEHDGTLKWESAEVFEAWQVAVALADLDADGDVEIMAGKVVLDHTGATLFKGADNYAIDIPFAADLDDDGDLEVLHGPNAYHHDGTIYYTSPAGISHPQIANLDADPEPEVLLSGFEGLSLLEHDGTVVFLNQKPNGDASWWRPAAIHDIDGDQVPEILVSSNEHYTVYGPDLIPLWSAQVQDGSGFAAGTAFDFLGAGYAQAMYADEQFMFVFGETGQALLSTPRSSWTQAENPVVADVDNDGSAEIVVVSNGGQPAVQVIRDVEDRWIQARRIWNQHAYHVTNVREDATIPQHQAKSWQTLNTFRTNAQIEGGTVCVPPG